MKTKTFLFFFALMQMTAHAEQTMYDTGQEQIPARCYFEGGKLHFASKNDKFKFWLDNRIFVDAAIYSPYSDTDGLLSKPNKDLETDDGKFRLNNGVSIRHARVGFKANLYERWFAELDLDFACNEVEIKDMFLGYQFNPHWSLKAGNFKEPMSMERLTSSRYLTLFERPLPVEAFASGRRLGAAFTGWGSHWWMSAGVFGREVDIIQKEKNRGSDGIGLTGRVAVSPVSTNDLTLHLGCYGSWRRPDMSGSKDRAVEFRTFPESRVDRRRFIRTEIKNVRHYGLVGVECGLRYRKALLYGEYLFASLSRYKYESNNRVNLKNATFNGWYVTGSYMLLGGQRRYAPEDAEFGPMDVKRKGGNLELSARVSTINLNDFHDPAQPILGGKGYTYTAAVNWYPMRNVMVGFNYTYVNNDKYADDKGHITSAGQPLSKVMPRGVDFGIYQMRFMVSF